MTFHLSRLLLVLAILGLALALVGAADAYSPPSMVTIDQGGCYAMGQYNLCGP